MSTAARICVIAGVGPGTGAALAKTFAKAGFSVALLARRLETLQAVESDITSSGGHAASFATDLADVKSVQDTFSKIDKTLPGSISCAIFNASGPWVMKPFLELQPDDLQRSMAVSGIGALAFAQEALRRMVKHGSGSLLFTGASASMRGSAKFAGFAPAKFATRALAQSLAREFGPQNIHVAHTIVDGIIDIPRTREMMGSDFAPDTRLDPDAIAQAYLYLHNQHKSCWTHELDLRPAQEKF